MLAFPGELYGHPAETPVPISEAFDGIDYYYKSIASARVVMAIREEVINSGADVTGFAVNGRIRFDFTAVLSKFTHRLQDVFG